MRRYSAWLITLIAVGVVGSACAAEPGARAGRRAARAGEWSPALVDTLLRLGREDQHGRTALGQATAAGDTATLMRTMRADSARSVWLRRVVQAHGWPTRASMPDSAARMAWLILQHSPFQDWQGEMLPTLEQLATRGELPLPDVALLTDRVLVRRGQPQRYGSQFIQVRDRLVPLPISDLPQLNARRAAMGLPPMTEYVRRLGEMNQLSVEWPPRPDAMSSLATEGFPAAAER